VGGINMGYTKINNNCLDTSNLSDGAFRLYLLLQRMCYGEKCFCFPSQDYLGAALNKSTKSIQRYINELVAAELIEKKRRGSTSNIYTVVDKMWTSEEKYVDNYSKSSDLKGCSPSAMEQVAVDNFQNNCNKHNNIKVNNKKNTCETGEKGEHNRGYEFGSKNKKPKVFNTYNQRVYNFENLEAMLLGHEKYDESRIYNS
jgi:Helix-turn-helix domain